MGFYEDWILPHLINCACGAPPVMAQRGRIVPQARGRVLEVGMGSGLNLAHYRRDQVDFVWGLEPSRGMRRRAARRVEASGIEVRWLDLPGEEIPLDDNSVDTVVLTYTLCTIPDWHSALKQMHRVLKPGGQLLFCEHGEAPDEQVRRWQERLNPYWSRLAGGCHLHRPIPDMLLEAEFRIETLESRYLPQSPRFAAFNYWGSARNT